MRVPAAQQPSAPPQNQQDLANNLMPTHNYVAPQNQIPQTRPDFQNFTFRMAQHGSRPAHPRQQGVMQGPAAGNPSVMYHQPIMYPAHLSMPQAYQQPRPQQYYPYISPHYMSFNNTPSHPSSYYYTPGSQTLTNPGLPQNPSGAHGNQSVILPGGPQNPSAPSVSMPYMPPTQPHIHPNMPGMRSNRRFSYRVPVIDPDTQEDILSKIDSNESSDNTEEAANDRANAQQEASRIAEEFARMVKEAANNPSRSETNNNDTSKKVEVPITIPPPMGTVLQTNTMSNINNNAGKVDKPPVSEYKVSASEVMSQSSEPPVVSAISDSPIIVPKICPIIKKLKSSEQVASGADSCKNVILNKPQKQCKIVPAEIRDEAETDSPIPIAAPTTTVMPPSDLTDCDEQKELKALDDKPTIPYKADESTVETIEAISSIDKLPVEFISTNDETTQAELLCSETVSHSSETEVEDSSTVIENVAGPKMSNYEEVPTKTRTDSYSFEEKNISATKEESANEVAGTESVINIAISQSDVTMKDVNVDDQIPNLNVSKNIENLNRENENEGVEKCEDTKPSGNDDDSQPILESNKIEKEELLNQDEENKIDDIAKSSLQDDTNKPKVFIPKYKYNENQWSPLNKTGKKCYDVDLLKQIKDDPMSKKKPDAPMLEQCNVMKTMPVMGSLSYLASSRPVSDTLMPNFFKSSSSASKNIPRDLKKDGRHVSSGGRGLMKPSGSAIGSSPHRTNVLHISISLHDDVKLNETENAWKPSRTVKENLNEDDSTEELYKKFRGILNKLTPQKFDTLIDKVKHLEINTQKRLQGIIDLVFEKAIDEPNFSEAYAAMCNKLSTLEVPSDTAPDKCANFRLLIINKCQSQFQNNVNEHVQKLEKELADCKEPNRKKEIQLQIEEENRKIRMKSVGNVRFIGELYKLKMLASKVMVFCMSTLIDKLEEEKLECLCKLLTTIGQQVESELHEKLASIFKRMQEIVDHKPNKISSRVRFMIQDVIALRKRQWVSKNVVDLQPKMMDQIQKEAEQQHRQTELLNSSMGSSYHREDGNRGKRGDSRRPNQNYIDMSNNWKTNNTRTNYSVDTSKLKVATNKNLDNIKLAPQKTQWGHGSGTKSTTNANPLISSFVTTTNKFSVLENVQTDPISLRSNKDNSLSYHSKGASIERSTFNSRDFSTAGSSRSESLAVSNPPSAGDSNKALSSVTTSAPPAKDISQPTTTIPQEEMTEQQKLLVKSIIDQCLINPVENEMMEELKIRFKPQHHSALISTILNNAIEKSSKDIVAISKTILQLISTNVLTSTNLLAGLSEMFEFVPDLYIDIPMIYHQLSVFIVPHIERKYVSFEQILKVSESVISANQGHLLLKSLIQELKANMGPSFVTNKWQGSGLVLKQWMKEDMISKFINDNNFQFLEDGGKSPVENINKSVNPSEAQSKLFQLMNANESCDCIRGWIQDNIGSASNQDWFMRSLFTAICEHALFSDESKSVAHFNQDKMNKYAELINHFGESKLTREVNCLFGIQQLIHKLEHPQGLTLEIFQYLNEQYVISVEGFIAWEKSEKEPEGKGVMLKVLTSFFTNIKETENEDSFSDE